MRRLVPTFVLAVWVALLAVGCGSSSSKSQTPPSTAPSTTTSTPVVTSSGPMVPGSPSGPKQIEPTHNGADVHPVRFDPTMAVPSAKGVLVRFYGGIAPCFVLDHYTVAETASTVTVTLYAGSDKTKPGTVCSALALEYEVDVSLQAPLGGRKLADGAA
jgi:hypothetical protein